MAFVQPQVCYWLEQPLPIEVNSCPAMVSRNFRFRSASARLWQAPFAGRMLAAGFTLAFMPRWCFAAPLSLEITTERSEAAPDCADDARLLGKVEKMLQRALGARGPESDVIRVHVKFDRIKDEYRAELEFKGPKPGERALSDRSDHCEPLEDAAAVAVALLLDTELERRVREAHEVERVVQTIQITRHEIVPRARAPRAAMLALGVEGGVRSGLSSSVSPGFALDVGTRAVRGWLFESSGALAPPMTARYGVGEVTVSLTSVGLRACRLWGNEWELGPCASLALGRLHGSGSGYDESFSSNLFWSAGGASMLLQRVIAGRWDIGLHAVAWAALRKQSFEIDGLGTAWRSSTFSTEWAARLGVRF